MGVQAQLVIVDIVHENVHFVALVVRELRQRTVDLQAKSCDDFWEVVVDKGWKINSQ